jgi:hypothetical protein
MSQSRNYHHHCHMATSRNANPEMQIIGIREEFDLIFINFAYVNWTISCVSCQLSAVKTAYFRYGERIYNKD